MTKYLKKLTYIDLLFIGIGCVVGAGIFALIGKASAYSNQYTWLSTMIAGIIMYYVSKSYIKINEIYDSNYSEHLVVNDAFGSNLSTFIMLCAIIGGLLTCYVVADALGGYASSLFSVSSKTAIISCIVICALINIIGIKELAVFNNITTIMGLIGLFLIIFMGIGKIFFDKTENKSDIVNVAMESENNFSLSGVAFSAYIMSFSYFGFESLIKFNEESINSKVDIGRAINLTILSATILYTLVSYISLKIVPSNILSKSNYPLAEVAAHLTTNGTTVNYIKLAAVLLTFNTYLISLGATSRLMDDFVEELTKPHKDKKNMIVNKNMITSEQNSSKTLSNTPIIYIMFATLLTILLYSYDVNMITATSIGNFCVILLFAIIVVATKIVTNKKMKN